MLDGLFAGLQPGQVRLLLSDAPQSLLARLENDVPADRIVVAGDDYHWHSDPLHFSRDRQRDYKLQISGYRVLRLPLDEVLHDVALAVEKIRDVVRLRSAR